MIVFLAMASGLACGLGYLTLAFAVTVLLGIIVIICFKVLAALFGKTIGEGNGTES